MRAGNLWRNFDDAPWTNFSIADALWYTFELHRYIGQWEHKRAHDGEDFFGAELLLSWRWESYKVYPDLCGYRV